MTLRPALLASMLLLGACARSPSPEVAQQLATLRTQVDALQAAQARLAQAEPPKAELGQQMLGLQIRHARLWAAGEGGDWLLAQFQLSELNEALDDVVAENPEHAALQPQRLADVLPMMMKPAVSKLRDAIDHHDKAAFESAYDGLSAACSGCHKIADHGFLVIQRPKTPVLDNLRTTP
jgi:uncharacterized protein HemX